MSISGYAAIEFRPRDEAFKGQWWLAARPTLYGDVTCFQVLAHPWPRDDKDAPKPVVRRKGLPKDLSIVIAAERREDPQPWRYGTWLTLDEVRLAGYLYAAASQGRRSQEIDAITAFMHAYETARPHFPVDTRLVLWFN